MTARMIDVDGHRLSMRVTGAGTPTVVCISSLGGAHAEWDQVAPLVADFTTVVTYARPGHGGSDALPMGERGIPRGGGWVAQQLHTMLSKAKAAPPYVLIGSSIAGFVADRYAAMWASEVAGMILIDPSNPRPFPGLAIGDHDQDGGDGAIVFSRDLRATFLKRPAPPNASGRFVVLSAAEDDFRRNGPWEWHQPRTVAEMDREWMSMQEAWAARLGAVHVVADTAGHLVHRDEPCLVAALVRAVVDAAREGRPIEFEGADVAATGGHLRRH